MSFRRVMLVKELIRKLGYVNINSLKKWLNLSSTNDARKLIYKLTRIDKDIEPVYTVTFEKEGPLASFSVEEVEESRLHEVMRQKMKNGWKLKSKYLTGAKLRGFTLMII
ncbi:MAG: hypothetical protein DRJ66_05495 [Thermoprotei archaeon]|nr:MAG: hypothetical protein DRJ66_05495 [Thermoprotei archaeon]RLF18257.1 MAG: hypothetical protein DRZ82_08580 [Thermoprotei archaeon]